MHTSRFVSLQIAALAFSLFAILPAAFAQQPSQTPESPIPTLFQSPAPSSGQQRFNGAFVEYSLRTGLSFLNQDELDQNWSLDAGIRHSFPMYLGDTRLAYHYDDIAGDNTDIALHGIGLTFGLHPFYLALLSNSLLGHALAAFHLELGVTARYALVDVARATDQSTTSHSDFGIAWSLGTGFDIPLWSPNHGHAPWLNFNYRYQTGRLDLPDNETLSLAGHNLFIGLGWRVNGLLF